MYQHSTNNYKYVSLDLTHHNQKKKGSRQKIVQHKDYGGMYGVDFNIQSSWVHGSKPIDNLKSDSMLAYSRRMNDIRRIRGIHPMKNSVPMSTLHPAPTLWINTGKGAAIQFEGFDGSGPKYLSSQNRLTKSLGSIKLEPLLGSRKMAADIEVEANLQTHGFHGKENLIRELPDLIPLKPVEPVKVRHITVTITIPPSDLQDDDDGEFDIPSPPPGTPSKSYPYPTPSHASPHRHLSDGQDDNLVKKKLTPLGSGRARPRKAKRMKITEPNLESINEDGDDNSIHVHEIEDGYNDLLHDVHHSQEAMLAQKRRTVALLRQTNYAQKSHQQTRQMAMNTLAKRKFRKLPPIPNGQTPSFRYTNNKTNGAVRISPYDE